MGFQEGDQAYIIINNLYTKPCTILRFTGDMYVISIGSGAMRVRESRLFRTAEKTGKPFASSVRTTEEVIQESMELQKETARESFPGIGYSQIWVISFPSLLISIVIISKFH